MCRGFEKTIESTFHLSADEKNNLKQQSLNLSQGVLEIIRSKCELIQKNLNALQREGDLREAKSWLSNFKEMIESNSTWSHSRTVDDLQHMYKVFTRKKIYFSMFL